MLRYGTLLAPIITAALVAGCSSLGDMPDLGNLPDRQGSGASQRAKIEGMVERAKTHETQAAKEIEKK